MKLFYTALCLLSFIQFYGQKVNLDPCFLYKQAIKNQNLDSIDHYLKLDDTQLYQEDRIKLLTNKAVAIVKLKKKKPKSSIIDSSAHLFKKVIDLVEDDNLKISYKLLRYETLSLLKPSYDDISSDKQELERHGFKDLEIGLSIHAVSKYDSDFWVGAEASLVNARQLPHSVTDGYGTTIKTQKRRFSMSALTVSYLRNLELNASEFKFSLLRMESPFYIDLTQFGNIKTDFRRHWFYRPQLGLGYRNFSISYGYNIFFKNSPSNLNAKHSINFKAHFMFELD